MMKLRELIAGGPFSVEGNGLATEVEGLTADSRQVRPGYVFVAVPGTRDDGRRFIPDAWARGAVAVCEERAAGAPAAARGQGGTRLVTADARAALAWLACRYYGNPAQRLRTVGITGTNGKTTVAFLVRDLFRATGWTPGLIGTVQYELGPRVIPATRTTPDAVQIQSLLSQMVSAGCSSAVLEVSSHALDQQRTAGIDFDAAVFTNLTRDHLDYHHDPDTYFLAKARLFEGLGHGAKAATAVLNADEPRTPALLERLQDGVACFTYGLAGRGDVRAEALALEPGGTRFRVESPWGSAPVHLPLPGRFNVANALAAFAVGGAAGLAPADMAGVLARVVGAPGRMEAVPNERGFSVFVDYAHTDDALQHVLSTVRELTRGRVITVFGCGGDRDRTKRPAMGRVAVDLADLVVVTSDNPRSEDPEAILDEILAGCGTRDTVERVADRRAAIRRALEQARPGDVVVIAGKGHENFQECGSRTVPFDDRQVVREWFEA